MICARLLCLIILCAIHWPLAARDSLSAHPAATAGEYLSNPSKARQAGLKQAETTTEAYDAANSWKGKMGAIWGTITAILGVLAGWKTLQAGRVGTTLRRVSGYVEDLKPYVDQVIGKDERKRLADQRYDRSDRARITALRNQHEMKHARRPDMPVVAGSALPPTPRLPGSDSHEVLLNESLPTTDRQPCPERIRS